MSESSQHPIAHRSPEVPSALIEDAPVRRGLTSLLWLVPILALGLSIGFAVRALQQNGPTIVIRRSMDTASVAAMPFVISDPRWERFAPWPSRRAPTGDAVRIELVMRRDAATLARAGTLFWIVRPQLSLDAITGLETIIGASTLPCTRDRMAGQRGGSSRPSRPRRSPTNCSRVPGWRSSWRHRRATGCKPAPGSLPRRTDRERGLRRARQRRVVRRDAASYSAWLRAAGPGEIRLLGDRRCRARRVDRVRVPAGPRLSPRGADRRHLHGDPPRGWRCGHCGQPLRPGVGPQGRVARMGSRSAGGERSSPARSALPGSCARHSPGAKARSSPEGGALGLDARDRGWSPRARGPAHGSGRGHEGGRRS